ncbi:Type II secretion system protein F [Novipirellula galeiformis]|uniref:General secretion pathway protein F n=1 Tax=Novipirellula galeiformis TaxID=2528004 RepID=A0A5C6BXW0_9BACT|nr:type II secretion system F family protein [Novipirellula galeiformis]TWU17143.1 Type II secretion system protein F [Novipirellula galeiformis]
MTDFTYTAKSATGEKCSGKIAAANRAEAMRRLRAQSLFPMSLVDPEAVKPSWTTISLPVRVTKEQTADFCTQLADLLTNGVPMLDSLKILAEAMENPRLQETTLRMHDAVSQGDSLDEAMARESTIFSELTLSMVRAGQEGAFLEEALQRTALFLRKQDEMRGKIVGALTYPIILGIVGTIITSLMIVFLVPKFQPFFDRLEQNGSGLPLITVLLLGASHVMMHYGIFLILGMLGVGLGIQRFLNTETGRRGLDTVKLKTPMLGSIFHDAAVSRACRVLGTLLRNGVPLLKSLKISSGSTGNRLLEEVMLKSAENVTAGDSLSKPLAASGLIPPQIMAMIRVAEESNTLDEVLVKIADRIDNRIERRLEVLVKMIEPMMLILIGSMVMFVIVGVLLPVFDLNSSVG